jgi:hypothetical protein
MENLNAEQVKKALENWMKNYDGNVQDFTILCKALALINLQEQRIGELEKRLRYLLQSKTIAEYDEVDIHTKEYVKDIHSLDANIKRLTVENEKIGIENFDLICELSRIKEDTVRKMQERLKEREVSYGNITFKVVPIDDIDQIAKEILEDAE